MNRISLTLTALVPLSTVFLACQDVPPTAPVEPSLARGGNGGGGPSTVWVQFRETPSVAAEGYFSPGTTLDFTSDAIEVQGRLNQSSLSTKSSPLVTLTMEPEAQLLDGKIRDEDCETAFFEDLLGEAAANGGELEGSLQVEANWDPALITVRFQTTIEQYEYLLRMPSLGDTGEHQHAFYNGESATLAVNEGHFSISRRESGRKGTWWELERCLVYPDYRNGILDFEVSVSNSPL